MTYEIKPLSFDPKNIKGLSEKLLLSHLNPLVDDASDAILASIRESYKGPVEFARDGMRFTP